MNVGVRKEHGAVAFRGRAFASHGRPVLGFSLLTNRLNILYFEHVDILDKEFHAGSQ
ncbi:hypothetical protein AVEN_105187-1, partial [Araneus ventricosus]